MAINIFTPILGQEITSTPSYCYLFEPLVVKISDSNPGTGKIYIDLVTSDVNLAANNVVDTIVKYAEFDIYNQNTVDVDLMELVKQYHDTNVYKYGNYDDINVISNGREASRSSSSQFKYIFQIYSDFTTTPTIVTKIPIIGGRSFKDFTAVVNENSPTTEAELYGVNLANRWINYPLFFSNFLPADSIPPFKPRMSTSVAGVSLLGETPCGGMIIWKSRLGGWLYWGMDIKTESNSLSYGGNVEVGMFEYPDVNQGDPFIAPDYSRIESSYSLSLKALGLSANEMRVLAGMNYSPAVYYITDNTTGKMELMKATSISTPISSLSNGGDFSVTLKSISKIGQKTR